MSIRLSYSLIATALVLLLGSVLYVMSVLVSNEHDRSASETRRYALDDDGLLKP